MRVLLAPALAASLALPDWDVLIRQARRANLLARLAACLPADQVPAVVRPHLESAPLLAQRQAASVQHELGFLRAALSALGAPVVLLKGAAYLVAGLQVGRGRMFSDIDILVPKTVLPQAETALVVNGWDFDDIDAYDSRYYRDWMHELPPMHHVRRGTALDVHHTILPPTARTQVASERLFEHLLPLPAHPGLFVLPPTDMVLHSATHLFHEGEFDNGLRDLFDLDALLREFSAADTGFWAQLQTRASELGLAGQLHHALRYCERQLGTPIPPAVMARDKSEFGSGWMRQAMLDFCFTRALRPPHASVALPGTSLALFALYVRSHWLRMPMGLLARHLGRKAWQRMWPKPVEPEAG
jgi:hypothetical protein